MTQLTQSELNILISLLEDNMARVDGMEEGNLKGMLDREYNKIYEKLFKMKKEQL